MKALKGSYFKQKMADSEQSRLRQLAEQHANQAAQGQGGAAAQQTSAQGFSLEIAAIYERLRADLATEVIAAREKIVTLEQELT